LTAIMTKIAGSALSSDVGGRVYLDEAPQEVEFPYIVFFIVTGSGDDNFTDNIDDLLIQFSLFSASKGAAEISGIYNNLETLFHDCELTATGYNTVWMKRENLTTMIDEVDQSGTPRVKHWAVDYRLITEKS
jgi:hypothetical protein